MLPVIEAKPVEFTRPPQINPAVTEKWLVAFLQDELVVRRNIHQAVVGLSGGVANNKTLRNAFDVLARRRRIQFLAAQPKHTGDNAGMIAFAAWIDPHATAGATSELRIQPSLTLAP